jgi:LysM repeat protein
MNSIRPLITITILVVVGAFLYVKINAGPVRSSSGAGDAWPSQSPDGVPPLAATSGPASQSTGAAPPWSASPPAAILASDTAATAATDTSAAQPPAVPPIPEIPDVPPPTQQPVPATASIPLPTELPANIPMAQYPDGPGPNGTVTSADVAASGTPPTTTAPAAPPTPTPREMVTPATPEQANSVDIAANNLSSQPLTAQQNPLAESPQPTGSDRYVPGAGPTEPATVQQPQAAVVQTSFATQWPTIQATLERGEFATAHQLLSRWYNEPSLTPTDAEMVENLLSQLAGTVVYSTEHQLEPAYVVKPGDTLETIAREYNVPWQLLAKINGIAAVGQVQPGQHLKVVRGPFAAVVDLGRKQLTLMVGDRYAGKFPVTVPSMAAVSEGEWLVDKKLADSPSSVTQSAYAPAPVAADRAIVLRSETATGGSASTVAIASGNISARSSAAGTPVIQVSPQDAEELTDILSIGSRVVIQR